jgi:soluble lytic murein transglycosylase
MLFTKILTPLAAALLAALAITALPAAAQTPNGRGDDTLLEMQQAFRKGDRKRLAALLPQARGHALEPWAAYWELRARLDDAPAQDVQDFFARYPGTYQEDRLRADWLLLLGQRRDWSRFAAEYPAYRMGDERELRCYALAVDHIRTGADVTDEVRRLWYGLRDADDGCTFAADRLHGTGRFKAIDVWRKARLAMDANRPRAARAAVEIEAPDVAPLVSDIHANPVRYLEGRRLTASRKRQELALLALIRVAATDPDQAARLLDVNWSRVLTTEERNWAWGAIGRQAAQRLQDNAATWFGNVTRDADLPDDMLGWKVRAALRKGDWDTVLTATRAMTAEAQAEPTWAYWRARALLAGVSPAERADIEASLAAASAPAAQPGTHHHAAPHPAGSRAARRSRAEVLEAHRLLDAIGSVRGFYEMLALEERGRPITAPVAPAPLTADEKAAARANPGLARALQAIAIGLRSEGVREWNYSTNLHTRGGMSDRERLAAADLACASQVWDRCINTSERTRDVIDFSQRYPMPFRDAVVKRAGDIGLDAAYVYGLIRQESRFVMDARSHVGASGLMQVMPATARWTAKKIGLTTFTADQITDRDTNIAIGTGYLKLVLDDFAGSMPLAAAAYNAGPSRPRAWRNGPRTEAAIWAENVPFTETRDYVKKVLANTTAYATILTGQPQSLKARLGTVGPRTSGTEDRDLP